MPDTSRTIIEPSEEISALPYSAIDYLANVGEREVDKDRRIQITQTCKDAEYIPKVPDAGEVVKTDGRSYQVMHNGLKVTVDGYYGEWVTNLITSLKGHHEPQEEKVFYELSKLFRPNTHMIELGSYWAYYSLWFHKATKGGHNICCEPDPRNREIGEANFALNGFDNVSFVDAAAGKDDGKIISFDAEHVDGLVSVPIRSVDSLVDQFEVNQLEVLHMDVQGAEYDALQGAVQTIKAGKLRFLFISTHHYLISRDPNIHQNCIDFIKELGGHIICEHAIHESYSGDGLIVASFLAEDKDLHVEVSDHRMADNQFRPYTKDLEIVFTGYEAQLRRLKDRTILLNGATARAEVLEEKVSKLEKDIAYLNNLNLPTAFKFFLKSLTRSIKYRVTKLIWGGSAGYRNTPAINELIGRELSTEADARQAIKVLASADATNIRLIMQEKKARKFVYESLRKTYRAGRGALRRLKGARS